MLVRVRGGSTSLTTYELKRAASWFGDKLLGRSMSRSILLTIDLVEKMRGRCGSISCSDWTVKRAFYVQIETSTGKRRKQLYILAHEMVHLKQIVKGELVIGPMMAWRGRVIDHAEPWEVEAYGLERTLYREYVKTC